MIRVRCGRNRLVMGGHAGYGEHGKDIVCAAASALVYALAEVLRETGRLAEAVMEPGRAEVTGRGECCREFAMARCGLEMLARQYPESVELGRDLPREGGSEWTSGR